MNDTGGGASRSTETAAGSSTATDVSLREYFEQRWRDHEILDEQKTLRFEQMFAALELRMDERFEALRREVITGIETSTTAVNKAETATERRFEAMNEFRGQLSDQATRFVTREEMAAVEEKMSALVERNRSDIDAVARRLS